MSVFLILAALPIAYALAHRWSAVESEAARLSRTPATPIGAVRDGQLAKVVGRLELAGPPLTAPLSGLSCAAYAAAVHYHDRVCRYRVASEEGAREFFVRDASGERALVRAPVALLSGWRSSLRLGWWQKRLERRLRRFLRRHDLSAGPSIGGAPWAERCDETVLLAADEVAIVGVAAREADPGGDERSSASYRTACTRVTFAGAFVFRVTIVLVALLGARVGHAQVSGTGAILGAPVSTAATSSAGSTSSTSVGIAPADGSMPESGAWPPWPGAPNSTFTPTVGGGAQAPSVTLTVPSGAAGSGTTAVLPPADPTAPLPPLTTTPSTSTSTTFSTASSGPASPTTTTTTTLSSGTGVPSGTGATGAPASGTPGAPASATGAAPTTSAYGAPSLNTNTVGTPTGTP